LKLEQTIPHVGNITRQRVAEWWQLRDATE
jgi:hypothetical protein